MDTTAGNYGKTSFNPSLPKRDGTFSQYTKSMIGSIFLHFFLQTAFALYGDEPAASDWLTYAYKLFLARVPVLADFDGGIAEGVFYFRITR